MNDKGISMAEMLTTAQEVEAEQAAFRQTPAYAAAIVRQLVEALSDLTAWVRLDGTSKAAL